MSPADLPIGWLAAGAGTLGASVAAVGMFHPRVPLFGPMISAGPKDRPAVAVTFDDGPHPRFTLELASMLERYGGRGTFFCTGMFVKEHPQVLRELLARGHELGNHTFRHGMGLDLFSARRLTDDLRRCQDAIAEATGFTPRVYRPAVGIRNPAVHRAARALGLTVVTWTDAARDGARMLSPQKAQRMGERAGPGSILTFHDGVYWTRDDVRQHTVNALPAVLDVLQSRGLALLSLGQLMAPALSAAPG